MGHRAPLRPIRATYADLEAVPSNQIAELIQGTLYTFPRPAPRHANTTSALGIKIGGPFHLGDRGPGGWWILDEPEIHFPDPTAPGEIDAVVPDLAGWKRARMPALPEEAYFTLAPDWVCQVLSKGTRTHDREDKMPLYAREGVRHAWLIDPLTRVLEVYTLGAGKRWSEPVSYSGVEVVRAAPFDAIEIDLSSLWA